jgi:phage shock protein A
MSLFDSISRTLKGLLNDAADSVQDPSRDSRQIVRELDDSIAKAENSLIEIQAQVATQQSKRDVAADKAKKYEDGAKRSRAKPLARKPRPKPSATRWPKN